MNLLGLGRLLDNRILQEQKLPSQKKLQYYEGRTVCPSIFTSVNL